VGINLRDYSPVPEKDVPVCMKIQNAINQFGADRMITINGSRTAAPKVFNYWGQQYYCSKYIGVLHYEDEEVQETITIGSRFDAGEQQNFLNYIFNKAYQTSGKIFEDMQPDSSVDRTWDMLLMLVYRNQLADALRKGQYRCYRVFQHNNARVKGKIEITRHMKENPLFNGRIAYSTREYTVDNDMNRLILLTYHCLEERYGSMFLNMIHKEDAVRRGIQQLSNEVNNSQTMDPKEILKHTVKPINHPLYSKYEALRKTCRMILKRLGFNVYSQEGNKVSGVLIDIASLWEKYLDQVLLKDLGTTIQGSHSILEKKRTITPDFFIKDKVVLDAKYRAAWGRNSLDDDAAWDSGVRGDVFQVLAYMYALNVDKGGVIFPVEEKLQMRELVVSEAMPNKYFCIIPYVIENHNDYKAFEKYMDEYNVRLQQEIAQKFD